MLYNTIECLLWKDYPPSPWKNHSKPRNLIKEGCHMMKNGIKMLINSIKLSSISFKIGIVSFNFAWGSSKANI